MVDSRQVFAGYPQPQAPVPRPWPAKPRPIPVRVFRCPDLFPASGRVWKIDFHLLQQADRLGRFLVAAGERPGSRSEACLPVRRRNRKPSPHGLWPPIHTPPSAPPGLNRRWPPSSPFLWRQSRFVGDVGPVVGQVAFQGADMNRLVVLLAPLAFLLAGMGADPPTIPAKGRSWRISFAASSSFPWASRRTYPWQFIWMGQAWRQGARYMRKLSMMHRSTQMPQT